MTNEQIKETFGEEKLQEIIQNRKEYYKQHREERLAYQKKYDVNHNRNAMTMKQIADQLKVSVESVRRNTKKALPNKVIENGKPTFFTEEEATVLLDYYKNDKTIKERTSTVSVEAINSTQTSLSPALKMKQAFDLMNEAYQEEITRLKQQNIEVVEENGMLKLENKQLVEENDYLKKANDFTTAQLGYYRNKYHSYYDDYEIY